MSIYEVRPARRADARVVRELLSSVLREHRLKCVGERAERDLDRFGDGDASNDHFVAVCGGRVVGFVVVVPLGAESGELSHVFVARAHRRHGVGTLLVDRAVEVAKERGYTSLHLSTMEAFRGAATYYERHGWVREREEGGSIFFTRRIREAAAAPQRLTPPIPRTLFGVLSLLDRFTRLRERLEREVASAAPRGRDRHPESD